MGHGVTELDRSLIGGLDSLLKVLEVEDGFNPLTVVLKNMNESECEALLRRMLFAAVVKGDGKAACQLYRWWLLALNELELREYLDRKGDTLKWNGTADEYIWAALRKLDRRRAWRTLELWDELLFGRRFYHPPFAERESRRAERWRPLQRLMLEEIFTYWSNTDDDVNASDLLSRFAGGGDALVNLHDLVTWIEAKVREFTSGASVLRLLHGYLLLYDPNRTWKPGQFRDRVAETLLHGWIKKMGTHELVPALQAVSPLLTGEAGEHDPATAEQDRPDLIALRDAAEDIARLREAAQSLMDRISESWICKPDFVHSFEPPNWLHLEVHISRSAEDRSDINLHWKQLKSLVTRWISEPGHVWLRVRLSLLLVVGDGQQQEFDRAVWGETD